MYWVHSWWMNSYHWCFFSSSSLNSTFEHGLLASQLETSSLYSAYIICVLSKNGGVFSSRDVLSSSGGRPRAMAITTLFWSLLDSLANITWGDILSPALKILFKDMAARRNIIHSCTDQICVLAIHGVELFPLLLMVNFTKVYSYL